MSEPPPQGLELTEVSGREICPLCRDEFQPESKVWSCRDCQTRYHQACQLELGGCSTMGCAGGGGAEEPSPGPRTRSRPEFGHCSACGAMAHRDDLNECPECGVWRHQACASQIGCGNASCGFRPALASPLETRRLQRQVRVAGLGAFVATLVAACGGAESLTVSFGSMFTVCVVVAGLLQASSWARKR